MSSGSHSSSPSSGYPTPREAPVPATNAERYRNAPEDNPTISGMLLVVLSRLVQHVSPLSQFLWSNAHFGTLKGLKYLQTYETRFDPCVVPTSNPAGESSETGASLFTKPDPAFYTSADYVQAYQSKRTTPTAVAEHLLSLIRSPQHSLGFIEINDARTLAAAKASMERYAQGRTLGPLDGVPIAVKDEVEVNGYRKTFGSARVFSGEEVETAWAVQKLEEAGAIVIGKTNMHELGTDTLNNNPVKGTPRNPYNNNYYTGGSSGGSAYAVGAGIVPIAVGADGGGSIRVPANYCGVYGIKPSHGRISARPSPSLTTSNGVLGPIAATLDDLALAYRVMAVPDSLDASSAAFPSPSPPLSPLTSPRRKMLGIFRPWFDDCSPTVRTLCNGAIQALIDQHHYEIIEIDIPYLHELRLAHALSIITEMHAAIEGNLTGLNAPNRILLSVAGHTPAHHYLQTAKLRALVMSHLAYLWSQYPGLVIATPTTPTPGVPIRNEGDLVHGLSDTNTSMRSMRYVFLANFSGCPAVVSGVGYDEAKGDDIKGEQGSGLLVSLMGMAEWGGEEALFGFAKDVANATVGEKRKRGEGWVDVLGAVAAGNGSS